MRCICEVTIKFSVPSVLNLLATVRNRAATCSEKTRFSCSVCVCVCVCVLCVCDRVHVEVWACVPWVCVWVCCVSTQSHYTATVLTVLYEEDESDDKWRNSNWIKEHHGECWEWRSVSEQAAGHGDHCQDGVDEQREVHSNLDSALSRVCVVCACVFVCVVCVWVCVCVFVCVCVCAVCVCVRVQCVCGVPHD